MNSADSSQKPQESKKKHVWLWYIAVMFGIFLIFVTISLLAVRCFCEKVVIIDKSPVITYHGPYVSIDKIKTLHGPVAVLGLESLAPPSGLKVTGGVLGIAGILQDEQVVNNIENSVVPEAPDIIEDAVTTEVEDEQEVENIIPSDEDIVIEYGIAAGGGPIYKDQDELDQYFQLLSALGAGWVRWDLDWGVVQPISSEKYDWSGADRVEATARKYNIKSLGIITYTPKWARMSECSNNRQCAPADPKAFGKFAGQVALRYKNLISHWEIWNEPNLIYAWEPMPSADEYAKILKEAYLEIKKVNPGAVVLSGGLVAAGDDGDGVSQMDFMNALYASGNNIYFDAVALHPYTYPFSPDYQVDWSNWLLMEKIHQLMADNSDGHKKIWATEFGSPTGGPGNSFELNQFDDYRFGIDYMSEAAQAEIMSQTIQYYKENSDWIGGFFWYSLHDAGDEEISPENFFGLLRYDGSKKPAYYEFEKAIDNN